MKTINPEQYQEMARKQVIQSFPLADIAILSLNKIIQNHQLPRQGKLKKIIEFNFAFSIVYHCLRINKDNGEILESDFTFMLLQLISWYGIESVSRSIYWAS